jgi:hypothetical protein
VASLCTLAIVSKHARARKREKRLGGFTNTMRSLAKGLLGQRNDKVIGQRQASSREIRATKLWVWVEMAALGF